MAKVNTSTATEVAKFLCLKTGRAFLIRSDGSVLRKTVFSSTWKKYAKLKTGYTVQDWIDKRTYSADWAPLRRGMMPSFEQIMKMDQDGIASATDGCEYIEPDGKCCHGFPSWVDVALRHAVSP